MKYGYKAIRKLSLDELRALCIQRNWYTHGDNEEYSNMLNMTNKDDITSDDIVEIASDIMEHSDLSNDDFIDVSDAILFKCHTFMVEA